MTLKDKKLLITDLCGRLPYKVMAKYYDPEDECETWDEIEGIESSGHVEIGQYVLPIESIKPYLFPLSSMTEEQKYTCPIGVGELEIFIENANWSIMQIMPDNINHFFNWLHKNHFDYRGLIEKSLALDATNLGIYE